MSAPDGGGCERRCRREGRAGGSPWRGRVADAVEAAKQTANPTWLAATTESARPACAVLVSGLCKNLSRARARLDLATAARQCRPKWLAAAERERSERARQSPKCLQLHAAQFRCHHPMPCMRRYCVQVPACQPARASGLATRGLASLQCAINCREGVRTHRRMAASAFTPSPTVS